MTTRKPRTSKKTKPSEKTSSGAWSPTLFTIPGHLPFADTLAAGLIGDGIPGILEPQGAETDPARLSRLTYFCPRGAPAAPCRNHS